MHGIDILNKMKYNINIKLLIKHIKRFKVQLTICTLNFASSFFEDLYLDTCLFFSNILDNH